MKGYELSLRDLKCKGEGILIYFFRFLRLPGENSFGTSAMTNGALRREHVVRGVTTLAAAAGVGGRPVEGAPGYQSVDGLY